MSRQLQQQKHDEEVGSVGCLRERYGEASERIQKMKFGQLDEFSTQFIKDSPLCFIATSSDRGADCSPRGGEPGFVKVVNATTLFLPDWSGNKRLDTMSNLLDSQGQCGLVFLVPYQDAFLRVNGRAQILVSKDVLEQCTYEGNLPTAVMRIAVQEVYFHCGRALKRSHLWSPEQWVPSRDMPGMGTVLKTLSERVGVSLGNISVQQLDRQYQEVLGKARLYRND